MGTKKTVSIYSVRKREHFPLLSKRSLDLVKECLSLVLKQLINGTHNLRQTGRARGLRSGTHISESYLHDVERIAGAVL